MSTAPSRVSLFITCFTDTLVPETGRAVVSLLERLGVAVDFPLEQTCCGQMHFNTGYAEQTIPLVRRFVRAFADSELVVSPSASCVGMVRDSYRRVAELSGDVDLAADVEALTPRVLELTELLVDRLGLEDVGAFFRHRVLAPRVAGDGVTVNAIALIEDTGMLHGDPGELARRVPMGRLGRPGEVAELALAVIHNGYVTNQVISVDGGMHPG